AAGRVDVKLCVLVEHVRRHHRLDHVVGDGHAQVVVGYRLAMLCRNYDGIHACGAAFTVLDRDLRLAVGPEKINFLGFAHFGELVGELVCELNGHGHQFGSFIARKTEHQALVARAARVHAHGDVGRLALYRAHNRAGLPVVAILRAVVAYTPDPPAPQ